MLPTYSGRSSGGRVVGTVNGIVSSAAHAAVGLRRMPTATMNAATLISGSLCRARLARCLSNKREGCRVIWSREVAHIDALGTTCTAWHSGQVRQPRTGGVREGSPLEVEAFDPAVQRPPAHAEQPRGLCFVAARFDKDTLDLVALRRRQEIRVRVIWFTERKHWWLPLGRVPADGHGRGEVAVGQHSPVAEDARALDDVAQLADIAGPGRALQ